MDLPEPRKLPVDREAMEKRRWTVLISFLWLIAAYVTLHKGIIPFILKFTTLKQSAYAHVDLWFFQPLLLALALGRTFRFNAVSSFLAGGGIIYGALELARAIKGAYPAWLGVSHLLSAIPYALICIALLSTPFPGKRPVWVWAGVVATGFAIVAMKGGL